MLTRTILAQRDLYAPDTTDVARTYDPGWQWWHWMLAFLGIATAAALCGVAVWIIEGHVPTTLGVISIIVSGLFAIVLYGYSFGRLLRHTSTTWLALVATLVALAIIYWVSRSFACFTRDGDAELVAAILAVALAIVTAICALIDYWHRGAAEMPTSFKFWVMLTVCGCIGGGVWLAKNTYEE